MVPTNVNYRSNYCEVHSDMLVNVGLWFCETCDAGDAVMNKGICPRDQDLTSTLWHKCAHLALHRVVHYTVIFASVTSPAPQSLRCSPDPVYDHRLWMASRDQWGHLRPCYAAWGGRPIGCTPDSETAAMWQRQSEMRPKQSHTKELMVAILRRAWQELRTPGC